MPVCFILLSQSGCDSNKRVDELESKLNATTARLDSFIVQRSKPWEPKPTWDYTWFDLGKEYHQIVGSRFYVSNIQTSYRENGFQVTGLIANLDAIAKSTVKVQCAIKDSTLTETLTFGYIEIPYLLSGVKTNFSVFVPSKQTKISQIGVWISSYRM
jgi:hypothetical protein